MKEVKIKAALSDGSSVLKDWEQPCHSDLPAIYEAAKQVKQSINDYLSQLVDQEKNSAVKKKEEPIDMSDEEEDIDGDSISGFINEVAMVSEKQEISEKRKAKNLNKGRKRRK